MYTSSPIQKTNEGTMAKERPKDTELKEPRKKGKELVSLVIGSYLTHSLSNVASMQIVRSNSSGTSRTNITILFE